MPPAGPVTWPDVIATLGAKEESGLAAYAELPERIQRAVPPRFAGGRLGGFDAAIAAVAVLRGPAVALPQLERIAPLIPLIVRQLGDVLDKDRVASALFTLYYLNAARCCGATVPDAARQAELRWIPQLVELRRPLEEADRHTLALGACAASLPAVVGTLADTRVPRTFAAGQAFGFDVPGFAGYLAAATEHGASYQDVEPAWLDFVHRFPYKLDARTLDWPALLYAARAVYATIGGLPEAEVADELHRLVTGA